MQRDWQTDIAHINDDHNQWKHETYQILNLIQSVFSTKEKCYIYSTWEIVSYNYIFILTFFFGLNFSHLNRPPMDKFMLKWSAMKQWNWFLRTILILIIIWALMHIFYVFSLYYETGVLKYYLISIAWILTFIIVVTYAISDTHHIHVHHYIWSLMLVMIHGYQSPYVTFWAGTLSGVMVEGVSRWGFSKLWHERNN